jgi:hypothetical protein
MDPKVIRKGALSIVLPPDAREKAPPSAEESPRPAESIITDAFSTH